MNDFLQGRARHTPLVGCKPTHEAPPALPALAGAARSTSPTPAAGPLAEKCEPRIELAEANGRIEQIIVTCGCGERITLQCAY